MKKTITMLIAMAMLVSATACTGDSGSADTEDSTATGTDSSASTEQEDDGEETEDDMGEKVTFSATFLQNEWHGDPNDMAVLTKLEEEANVEVEWDIQSSATWGDKKNLMITSGELPDVFYMNALNSNDVNEYAPQGMIIELTDLIAEHAPRLSAVFEEMPNYKSVCVNPDDGKIYSIARAAEREAQYGAGVTYINKAWLDQLGLDIPETTEDFYNALKAFKDNDPNGNSQNDEIPYTFHWNVNKPDQSYNFSTLFGSFGYTDSTSHFIADENGEVVYTPQTEEWKEAIKYFATMFEEELFDAEGFTTQDTSVMNAKGFAETPVLGAFTAFDHTFIIPAERYDDYVVLPPLAGPEGDTVYMYNAASNGNVNGTQFIMTVEAQGKEEGIMRWLDAHFDPITSAELFLGAVDTTLEMTDSGMLDYIDTPEGMSYSEFRYGAAPVHVPCVIAADDWGTVVEVMDEDVGRLDIFNNGFFDVATQSNLFTRPNNEESDYFLKEGKDIDDYVNTNMVKWMTEGGIDAEWDQFQTELANLGIDQYTEYMVASYERAN